MQGAQSDKGEDASAASDAVANGAKTDDINDMGRRTQGQMRASGNRHNASATHDASAATSLKNNKADAADAADASLSLRTEGDENVPHKPSMPSGAARKFRGKI